MLYSEGYSCQMTQRPVLAPKWPSCYKSRSRGGRDMIPHSIKLSTADGRVEPKPPGWTIHWGGHTILSQLVTPDDSEIGWICQHCAPQILKPEIKYNSKHTCLIKPFKQGWLIMHCPHTKRAIPVKQCCFTTYRQSQCTG